jgi:hypothetical protein
MWLGVRPIFRGWNNYSQLSLYFPIFPWYSNKQKKNLHRQRVALNSPKEILWKWHLRYLITTMRLEANERPSSWWLPWSHLLRLWEGPQQLEPPGACFKCNQRGHWAKGCCQDLVHNVVKMDTRRSTSPLCLYKVGQSLTPVANRLKASWTSWTWQQNTDAALGPQPPSRSPEEPRGTVQVAGRPQSPTWCYLISRVSFILHRSPWWGWMVSSTSQKNPVLFKFKILIKVNFKIQVTK